MLRAAFALVLCSAAAAAHAQPTPYDRLEQARFVHCAFYRDYEVDRATGDRVLREGRSDSLTHFQMSGRERARQISTRMAGAREVEVRNTGRYLHYLDRIEGMYLLTTVYGCLEREPRSGACATYGAVQSRHFDSRVLSDPDSVYEALKDLSDPGFCDHSFYGTAEASRGAGEGRR